MPKLRLASQLFCLQQRLKLPSLRFLRVLSQRWTVFVLRGQPKQLSHVPRIRRLRHLRWKSVLRQRFQVRQLRTHRQLQFLPNAGLFAVRFGVLFDQLCVSQLRLGHRQLPTLQQRLRVRRVRRELVPNAGELHSVRGLSPQLRSVRGPSELRPLRQSLLPQRFAGLSAVRGTHGPLHRLHKWGTVRQLRGHSVRGRRLQLPIL